MEYKKFAVFNVVGGIFWICSTTLLGYFLGNLIPNIEKYIHYVIAVVIVFSLLPIVYELIKNKRSKSV